MRKQDATLRGRASPRGFTLVELLTVMALIVIMMAVAVPAFVTFTRTSGLRTSMLNLRSSISHARQYAVTHNYPASIWYGNQALSGRPRGCYWVGYVWTNGVTYQLGETNLLAEGLCFTNSVRQQLQFLPDGKCDRGVGPWSNGTPRRDIGVAEQRPGGLKSKMYVYLYTGRIESTDWVSN